MQSCGVLSRPPSPLDTLLDCAIQRSALWLTLGICPHRHHAHAPAVLVGRRGLLALRPGFPEVVGADYAHEGAFGLRPGLMDSTCQRARGAYSGVATGLPTGAVSGQSYAERQRDRDTTKRQTGFERGGPVPRLDVLHRQLRQLWGKDFDNGNSPRL